MNAYEGNEMRRFSWIADLGLASIKMPGIRLTQAKSKFASLPAGIKGWVFVPTGGSQRDADPAMGLAGSTVGRDAGKRLRLSNGH